LKTHPHTPAQVNARAMEDGASKSAAHRAIRNGRN
jgi:hypothetical protein